MRFYGADDFLARFTSTRLVYLSGKVGSGKTSFAVALSWLLHTSGLVDATISNVPVLWASPLSVAPGRRFAIIVDELGVFYDARQVVGKGNDFRKILLGFPRKIDSYVIVSSRVVVDKSFRALTVQRDYRLPFGWSRYVYGEDDGVLNAEGNFWVHRLSDVWPYYDNLYIPPSVDKLAEHVRRSAEKATGGESDPNEHYPLLAAPVSQAPDSVRASSSAGVGSSSLDGFGADDWLGGHAVVEYPRGADCDAALLPKPAAERSRKLLNGRVSPGVARASTD